MKRYSFSRWIGFLILIAALVGCAKKTAAPTITAEPQTLPTITPTPTPPVGEGISPLPRPDDSPLPFPAERDESGPVSVPAQAEAAVAWAVADMAERLGISEDEIEVVLLESVQWRDSSLGCPEPGMVYAQVITPGYRFVLGGGGEQFEYHSAKGSERAIFCPNGNIAPRDPDEVQ